MSRTHVNLNATYLLLDDSPAVGSVDFTLVATLENTGDNVMYPPVMYPAPLVAGSFSIDLPATNDPDTHPSGLTYKVVEKINGVSPDRTYNIVLDYTLGTTQNLADLVPTTPLPLVQYIEAAVKVVAGAVSDASFSAPPPDGTIAVDSTDRRIYVRIGGLWKSVAVA